MQGFDKDQYAYLKNRSVTQAILIVVESIKKGLLNGDKAAAVFFDFTDAFGTVNRRHLLRKISRDLGISGRLFLHIASFLRNRLARIKMDDDVGDWLQSNYGTSAGTSLGPLLFVIHTHDVPKSIMPKFADDLVAISVEEDISAVEESLQNTTNKLIQWAHKEGMIINTKKTKVMVFGDVIDEVKIKINDTVLENVKSYKYLGVVLV